MGCGFYRSNKCQPCKHKTERSNILMQIACRCKNELIPNLTHLCSNTGPNGKSSRDSLIYNPAVVTLGWSAALPSLPELSHYITNTRVLPYQMGFYLCSSSFRQVGRTRVSLSPISYIKMTRLAAKCECGECNGCKCKGSVTKLNTALVESDVRLPCWGWSVWWA